MGEKKSFNEKANSVQDKLQRTGDVMSRIGYLLTCLITLPIFGVLVFGAWRLVVGIILGVMLVAGGIVGKKKG